MTTTIPTTDGPGGAPGLARLLTWFSPFFPIGAFAHSNGLEAAIGERRVAGADDLTEWLVHLLGHGQAWNDGVLMAEAFRLAERGDEMALRDLGELALALAGTAERRSETQDLGSAFAVMSTIWGGSGEAFAFPVAVGARGAAAGARLPYLSLAFLHGFAANLVSAAVRLVPLGQSDAVRVLHRLEPVLERTAARVAASTLDDLGGFALLSDISAMRHETMRTRLFRT